MTKTLFRGIVLVCLMVIAITACNKKNDESKDDSSPIKRIIVLSPEVAEIVAALGAEDRIIGITEECNYPASLQRCVKVGKFGNVNKEIILSLRPDIIFTSALEQEALTQELLKLGLRVEQIYPRSIKELPQVIEQVGTLIGEQKKAEDLAQQMSSELKEISEIIYQEPRPKVYLEIYRDPLMSVSDASFVGEIIETAGGDNIFSTLERDYARVEAEDVVKAMPDIMICYSQDTLESILQRKGWQSIPAIRNKRVYFEKDLNPDWILRASPRSIQGIRRLNEIIRHKG